MKQFIYILALFLPAFAQAQKYTVSDTSYTVNTAGKFFEVRDVVFSNGEESHTKNLIGDTAGKFFEVRDVVFSNGEESHTKNLIGDTAALFSAYYDRFVQQAVNMATDVRAIVQFPAKIAEMNKTNTQILAITGRDIVDTITKRLSASVMADGWTIKTQGGTAQDIAFTINNAGQLRYAVGGDTRNALFFGAVIRLNNFSTAGALDLYLMPSGNYRSADGNAIMRRPGGPQNRAQEQPAAVKPIPTTPAAIPQVANPLKTTKKKKKANAKN